MAWKTIRNRKYYFMYVNVGGRRKKEIYVGPGEVGAGAARRVAMMCNLRKLERAAEEGKVRRALSTLAPIRQLQETADVLTRAALVVSGYHLHARGAWRKRREKTKEQ